MSVKKMITVMATLLLLSSICAAPAFARSVNLKQAGAAAWVFVFIGLTIILLQLIPAGILVFAFFGATVTQRSRSQKVAEPEVTLPRSRPVEGAV